MKKVLLASVAGVALVAGAPAHAADLGTRPTYKAPPVVVPVPIFSWTGCYIGAHVGGGWGRKDFSNPEDTFDFAPPGATIRINTSGWFAGGQVGCDYQFAPNWVIGIEGSGSGADIKGSAVDSFFNGKNESLTFHAKTDWFASATARVGVTWDRWMLYAKGGAAWAGDKYSALGTVSGTCATAPCAVPFDFTASETRTGWTAGVGIEWAFWNNWSARLEYDHYDFGTRSVNLSDPNFTPTFIPADIKQRFDTVRLGINYRFGWGKAPVVARY